MAMAFVANGPSKNIAPVISANAAYSISTERAMSLSAGVDIPAAIRTWMAWSTCSTLSPISLRMLAASASCEHLACWMEPSYLVCGNLGTLGTPFIFWAEDPTSLKPPFQILLVVSAPVWSYHQIWSCVCCHHSGWRNCNQPTHHSGIISKASGYTRYGSDIVGLHSKRNGT